jgi:rhodanese-related sulfurtransferase
MTPFFPMRGTVLRLLTAMILIASSHAFAQTPILGGAKERQPSYGELENFTILSYSDLNGWDQAAEFRVSKDGKHAYISNYQGFSIVDVSDPARPKVISQVKNDPSVQSQYIDEIPKSGRVVLYCDCKTYDIADRAVFLEYRGYRNIFVMPEGYSGWVKRGYPLETNRR